MVTHSYSSHPFLCALGSYDACTGTINITMEAHTEILCERLPELAGVNNRYVTRLSLDF